MYYDKGNKREDGNKGEYVKESYNSEIIDQINELKYRRDTWAY